MAVPVEEAIAALSTFSLEVCLSSNLLDPLCIFVVMVVIFSNHVFDVLKEVNRNPNKCLSETLLLVI